MMEKVVAVVVTYNSDFERFREALFALVKQCAVVVVDNSTKINSREEIRQLCNDVDVTLLSLGGNFGIARAQNIGISWASEHKATDVLLLDDDSIPSPNLVVDLLNVRKTWKLQPVVVSARTISSDGEDLSNQKKTTAKLISCNLLTSSGSLIPIAVLKIVGCFDERLFIDCVDFEWGWRCLANGVPLLLSNEIAINHRLGDGKCYGLKMPSPIRHYYQYRNILRLIFNSGAPLIWRLSQAIKLPIKLIILMFFAKHPFLRLKYAFMGVVDFFAGRTGMYNH
jgi:rhamnosyltransferase